VRVQWRVSRDDDLDVVRALDRLRLELEAVRMFLAMSRCDEIRDKMVTSQERDLLNSCTSSLFGPRSCSPSHLPSGRRLGTPVARTHRRGSSVSRAVSVSVANTFEGEIPNSSGKLPQRAPCRRA